jgi:acyl carrier protein
MLNADDRLPDIIDRLKRLVLTELDVRLSVEQIEESTPLFEGGMGLDSFAVVELIGLIERDFAFEFPESDLTSESFSDLRTLGGVIVGNLQRLG